jgi:hypothetical protein
MYELLAEFAAEVLPLLGYGAASLLVTSLGFLAERAGLQHLAIGDSTLGIWLAGMGIVFLYAGVFLLGYRGFVSQLGTARSN